MNNKANYIVICPFSMKHILTESIDIQSIRVNYYCISDISLAL